MRDTCPACGGPMYVGLNVRECLVKCSEGVPRWLKEVWPYVSQTHLELRGGGLWVPEDHLKDEFLHRNYTFLSREFTLQAWAYRDSYEVHHISVDFPQEALWASPTTVYRTTLDGRGRVTGRVYLWRSVT